jgi:hypothetical protein
MLVIKQFNMHKSESFDCILKWQYTIYFMWCVDTHLGHASCSRWRGEIPQQQQSGNACEESWSPECQLQNFPLYGSLNLWNRNCASSNSWSWSATKSMHARYGWKYLRNDYEEHQFKYQYTEHYASNNYIHTTYNTSKHALEVAWNKKCPIHYRLTQHHYWVQ